MADHDVNGFVIVNPEVLIARQLERGGRGAPGLDFIRWRFAALRAEVLDDAEFWGIPACDIARSRAEQLAAARGGNERLQKVPILPGVVSPRNSLPEDANGETSAKVAEQ